MLLKSWNPLYPNQNINNDTVLHIPAHQTPMMYLSIPMEVATVRRRLVIILFAILLRIDHILCRTLRHLVQMHPCLQMRKSLWIRKNRSYLFTQTGTFKCIACIQDIFFMNTFDQIWFGFFRFVLHECFKTFSHWYMLTHDSNCSAIYSYILGWVKSFAIFW